MDDHEFHEERERLLARQTELATLAGGLAHEIRNPLSTIRMNLDLLCEDVEELNDPRQRRMQNKLERIRGECLHLEEILHAFMQFARAGELEARIDDLGSIVADFIEFYRPEAEQHGIEISPHLSSSLPPVRLDRSLMRQVLMNLTRNAQQAMPDGGLIELQTYTRDGRVYLEIIDTGPGMDADTRSQMFHAFHSTKTGGSGLGLPTVRKIIEAHGGTIDCESDIGRGTRFILALPMAEQPAPPEGAGRTPG
ncbi:Sensor protein ZraS [Maioricimonas rarisocia]|uniref:histidine kinase n=1 Tax=Maioricimonas rarisocia TaxID=2528026 RepID=A0A517ZDU4_9PLAN|nr:ATP-binding protein [Maioricimonas rarisocia]QDU40653.1 Sensor protein ZraS [Maioricimonas rarisocia]